MDWFLAISKLIFSRRQSRRYYSQFGEDAVLSEIFARKKKRGTYVDIGCYHPRKHSNTYLFYKRGWSGILVDVEKAKIIACRILRPRDKSLLKAVSDKNGQSTIYAPKKFSVLTSLSPVNPDYKAIGQIECVTLTNILDEHLEDRPIDLLSIDVEGHDLQVLKGLDFSKYQPEVIVIENLAEKDIQSITQGEIHNILACEGYNLIAWAGPSLIYGNSKQPEDS